MQLTLRGDDEPSFGVISALLKRGTTTLPKYIKSRLDFFLFPSFPHSIDMHESLNTPRHTHAPLLTLLPITRGS